MGPSSGSGEERSRTRHALAGALTGAVLGAAGRATVALAHLDITGRDAVTAAALAAVIGATIGGVAGLTGRSLAGIVIGAALTFVAYAATLPIVAMFQLLGAATTPSVFEVLAVGAISGGIGAFVGGRRRALEPRQ